MIEERSAAWMRNEHKINSGLMASLMRDVCAIPAYGREEWLDHLRQTVALFRAHRKNRISAEEADEGFLSPVLEARPTLSPQVEQLRSEHRQFVTWLDQIHEQAVGVQPEDRLLIEDLCNRVESIVKAIQHHQEHEDLLVTFVFSQDIGTTD